VIYRRCFSEANDSVRGARSFARGALDGTPPAVVDAVLLMVSELASNAVQHAASGFEVVIDRGPSRIVVDVKDNGSGSVVPRQHRVTDANGRGLQIVGSLADEWGVRPASRKWRKSVWFAIAIPRGAG
jgi:two-component sensor histidine kinase